MAIFTTSNGRDYKFSFDRRLDGSVRAYITGQPDYGSQSEAAAETHRMQDADGRWYVPWDEALYTVAEAKEVASAWAKRTDFYIDTGEWIPYEKPDQHQPFDDLSVPQGSRRETV